MGLLAKLVLTLFFASEVHAAEPVARDLCDGRIRVESPVPIKLTDAELILVCGDANTQAWSDIPPQQSAYFLKIFFNDRGYHDAEATIAGKQIVVRTGPQLLVTEVTFNFDKVQDETAKELLADVDVTRYWPILGRPITPKALDDLQKWLSMELSQSGMPCAQMTVRADPESGIVAVTVEDAKVFDVPRIRADAIPGVNGKVQQRQYAFDEGDRYDSLELDLSARRLVQADVVVSSNFVTRCLPDQGGIEVEQQLVPGEPRLVSAGIGFDTEEYAIGEASWRHARLGSSASNVSALVRGSYRRQTARLNFDWYYAPIITHHFLRSTATHERINERREDTRTSEVRFGPVWHLDVDDYRLELFSGGALRHMETQRGVGPTTSDAFIGIFNAHLMSHDFEYYAQAPRSGHEIGWEWTRAKKGLGSDISFSRHVVTGTALWTLFALDPPIWILGLRAAAASTGLDADTTLEEVPLTLRNFLGGSRDMRGFGRRAIPPSDEGALTTVYSGVEMRVREVIPFNIHPFVFVDYGQIGGDDSTLSKDVFWSPGIGTQWQSPIGTFRTTLAHGFIDGPSRQDLDYLARWQFYLSFGEQF